MFAYWVAREGGCKNQNADGKRHVLNEIADGGWGKGRRPLINVNWYDAECYAQWLTEKTGTNKNYRLLTEAEWGYAARARKANIYYWDQNNVMDYAWYIENSDRKCARRSVAGSFRSTATAALASVSPKTNPVYFDL